MYIRWNCFYFFFQSFLVYIFAAQKYLLFFFLRDSILGFLRVSGFWVVKTSIMIWFIGNDIIIIIMILFSSIAERILGKIHILEKKIVRGAKFFNFFEIWEIWDRKITWPGFFFHVWYFFGIWQIFIFFFNTWNFSLNYSKF